MPVSTASAAYHIAPVVLRTFFAHARRKTQRLANWNTDKETASDDIFFDEGFHIVKAFLDMATHNTVESLQSFANTHIPSPPWAAVAPVLIPLSNCNKAADIIVDWFGPEEIQSVVGGERWWQVRGLDGVDGEWLTDRDRLRDVKLPQAKKLSPIDTDILRMDHLDTVMFYVHGGGYYFGSINTHRYQILRYARKFKGRAFAVNYRKAPQYPFPCAIQDVLAAYLYMVQPPKDALHSPVPADKIVFAGDSAGGGLCLEVLCIIRDMGLPMPAGACLISPWVDLTHSFPSVMQNVDTDIIPSHGFMAKPSTLWPLEDHTDHTRVVPTTTDAPPPPGYPEVLQSDGPQHLHEETLPSAETRHVGDDPSLGGMKPTSTPGLLHNVFDHISQSQNAYISTDSAEQDTMTPVDGAKKHLGNAHRKDSEGHSKPSHDNESTLRPPKVLMENPSTTPLELRAQIQLYATNEQLVHPACSPILQGSLGNLCPLYIIAGNSEALRDEIIYMAHRCAAPDAYPIASSVTNRSERQRKNAEAFKTPTKVHLQVFDDMCHVLTVFLYTDAAKYAYRSIAQFIMHVTSHSQEHVMQNPFPELHFPRRDIPPEASETAANASLLSLIRPSLVNQHHPSSDIIMYRQNEDITVDQVQDSVPSAHSIPPSLHDLDNPTQKDIIGVSFLRQRVDIRGQVRSMEPAEEMDILKMEPSQIGIFKEAPVRRWMNGQKEWDQLFREQAQKVPEQRRKNEAKAKKMIEDARDKGLLLSEEVEANLSRFPSASSDVTTQTARSGIEIQGDRRWGPLDLDEECPPPSAICNRKDTPEALALLKKSIFYTAPSTHRTIPRRKLGAQIRSAFNPHDRVLHPPKQSASEQQQSTGPMHGLQMWSGIVNYFMKQSTMQIEKGKHLGHTHARRTSRHISHRSLVGHAERRVPGRNP